MSGIKRLKVALLSTFVVISLIVPMLALNSISEAEVYSNVDNIVVRGKDNAYSYNNNPPAPLKTYVEGDRPPIMMAQRVGSGAVVAAGFVHSCRGTASNDFVNLVDAIFQWMVPSQYDVLWFNGYGTYCTSSLCSDLISKLGAKGYTVTGDDTEPITSSILTPYDFLVIAGPQLGSASVGGDPDQLHDSSVAAIKSFVEGGGGLLIMDGSDFFGPSGDKGNFYRVPNKILGNLGFFAQDDIYFGFQSDSIYDDVNNTDANYSPIVDVDNTHPIGTAYQTATGKTTVGLYGICSLTEIGPGISLYVIPQYEVGMPGDNLTWRVKVFNTGTEDYTVHLTVGDTKLWNPTFDINDFAFAAGENETVIMSVIVPGGTPLCTEDEITVTAAAVEYPDVSADYTCIAHSGLRLEVTADAQVSDQDPDEAIGTTHPNYLSVGRYYAGWQYVYLRWDNLDEIPSDATITDAKIYLFGWEAYGSPQDMLMCELDDDTWDESTITWNNKPDPPYGDILDSIVVSIGSELDPETYVWDVTSYIQQEFAGNKVASFCLRPDENCPESTNRTFESKEWWDSRLHPFLRITTENENLPGVNVTISPDENEAENGQTVTFTVTVKNTGNVLDTYTLENTDNAGWTKSLSKNPVGPLSPNASENVTLSVVIPADAKNGDEDVITVTATGTGVSDNGSCTARCGVVEDIRGVQVSISPSSQENENGGTLTYTVTVKNTGNVTEDYNLSKSDDAGWTLTLPATATGVIPDESREVTLTVGIPSGAENCTHDNITVTATSQADNTVENSATCVAHCLVPPERGVQVTISDTPKSDKPGERLDFYVTVTNTGEETDTFTLTATDTEDWGPTLTVTTTPPLEPGASRQNIRLSITIPSTAAEGDSTTITVIATSQADSIVSDTSTARATAKEDGLPVTLIAIVVVVVVVVVVVALMFLRGRKAAPSWGGLQSLLLLQ